VSAGGDNLARFRYRQDSNLLSWWFFDGQRSQLYRLCSDPSGAIPRCSALVITAGSIYLVSSLLNRWFAVYYSS